MAKGGPLGAIAALLASGCSLVVDGEVRPHTCVRSAQCEVLNVADGIAAGARERWYCPPGAPTARVCTLGPVDEDGDRESPVTLAGGTDCDDLDPRRARSIAESPDGVDNDCDGIVDDGVWAGGSPAVVAAMAPAVATWSSTVRADGALYLAVTTGARGGLVGALTGEALELGALRYRTVYRPFSETLEADGVCPMAGSSSACDVRDLAVAEASAGSYFAAAVNGVGCAGGQLRLGWYADAERAVILDATGQGVGSNVPFGVDVGADTPCTGASRSRAVRGASRPNLAAPAPATGSSAQALAVWLARDLGDASCGGPAEVEALGAWLETRRDERNVPRTAVMATDGGSPRTLGVTLGSGRPAVVSLGAAGYVVAFGTAEGVVLRAVPAFAPQRPGDAGVAAALTVPPSVLRVSTAGANPADEVVVAVGAPRGEQHDLGVAWREACGTQGAVRFARVRWDPRAPERSTVAAVAMLARGAAAGPAVAYVDRGVRVEGSLVAGRVVSAADDGGWVVVWTEVVGDAAVVRAARVDELEGAVPEEDGPPRELLRLAGNAGRVALGPHAGAPWLLRVLAHDGAGARWLAAGALRREPRSP